MPPGKRKRCPGFLLLRWAVLKWISLPSDATSKDIITLFFAASLKNGGLHSQLTFAFAGARQVDDAQYQRRARYPHDCAILDLVGGAKPKTCTTRARHDATLRWHFSNHSTSLLGVGNERR